ncbi:dicarboxylate/amino acid:cation symporter [Treponema primitia]|uniref:cation:dicarboxylate symporter family transporter n=1 Tax=Treponema primitia TaxID=88058 RepID=UPI0039816622
MKVWLKLLIGSLLGVLLGYLLPNDNQRILSILSWLERIAIRIGRYGTVPILIFSLTIAIYELRQDGQFWRLILRSFLLILGSAVFVVASGIMVTMIFPPDRIPIQIDEQVELISLNVSEAALELFPSNMFSALFSDGVYLLPLCVFAFFLGMGLSYDRNYTKPVISLLDSLSRIFYHVASFFSEILGLIIIVLAAYWAIRFHGLLQADVFKDLILLLAVFSVALGFIILPLFLYFIKPKVNPWVQLYGSLGPALASFFSGDINFSIPVIIRHVKENLGARRRSNTVTVTLFAAFGRAGSAMVAAAAFIVIIKSYSSLGITLMDVVSIGIRAVLISFLLARHSGDAAYTALAALCLDYGRGYEAGYLILKPMAFYLIAIGAFLDVMISCFASFALARGSGFQEDREPRHFI